MVCWPLSLPIRLGFAAIVALIACLPARVVGALVFAGVARYSGLVTTGQDSGTMCGTRIEDGAIACWGLFGTTNYPPKSAIISSGSCGSDYQAGCIGLEQGTGVIVRWYFYHTPHSL